jgi:predicted XRE-type DNA-binding protein
MAEELEAERRGLHRLHSVSLRVTGEVSRRQSATTLPVAIDEGERSGNIFADIGVPNAEEVLFKADLAITITDVIQRRRLSQSSAAEIVGIDQPKVSALVKFLVNGSAP